ncbi:pyridoxamine 5'-phosphate oxidase family protein [Helicobacter sp. 11S02629-2]|uniref:pyridoxamine 5'-phosphate oxidase family protein n=1 Tax=Helicobacter sp. 11S02629-2 TaxID=1476195 RepID=UPI000BA64206|nr:pyridoxamine 5'-phosphate oxidase family protein [Helicobacter sp. 11S02629-2]PAF45952.1 hypothetical protein BKH40_00645 [Helicobacter sp. 11S02629-2]
MRRKDREITNFKDMFEILKLCNVIRLGLINNDGLAYILPLSFGYTEVDCHINLYFHSSTEGKKIELIKKQELVSFEMDRKHSLIAGKLACDYSFAYQSIMGKGKLCIVEDEEERLLGLKALMSHYTLDSKDSPKDAHEWEFKEASLAKVVVIKLSITSWSCKEHLKGM